MDKQTYPAPVGALIDRECKLAQAEYDKAVRYCDECAERHAAAMRSAQTARARLVALLECKQGGVDIGSGC